MMLTLIFLWSASGVASHIYWVRNKYDYTSDYIPTSVLSALIGPLAWFVGRSVYGTEDKYERRVLFKRRVR